MIKYKLTAVIPTVQYGNIQPSIELEGEDMVALRAQAEAEVQQLWSIYGERPLVKKTGGGVEVISFTGEKLLYDDAAHAYFDLNGNKLVSGSEYAASKTKPFDKENVVAAAAKSWGVDPKDLVDLWEINARISTEYGSAVHSALETYHLYHQLGKVVQEKKGIEQNYALPKIPYLRDAVLSFVEQFGADAVVEPLVSDVKNGRAGRIDRLKVIDEKKKICRIGDYKTNFELDEKKLTGYQHQLSFYAAILKAHGWTVEGLDLYHFSEGWTHYPLEVLPLE